jgi:hypothetical protein
VQFGLSRNDEPMVEIRKGRFPKLLCYFASGGCTSYLVVGLLVLESLGCSGPRSEASNGELRYSLIPPGPYCDFGEVGGLHSSRSSWFWVLLALGSVVLPLVGRYFRSTPRSLLVAAFFAGGLVCPAIAVAIGSA